jgi:hypothetical protein
MPDPVYESIAKNIETTLEAITGAGYTFALTAATVQRRKQGGQVLKAVPNILIHEGPEDVQIGPANGDYTLVTCFRQFDLRLTHRIDEASETRSGDEMMNLLTADVQKAMMVDPKRGNYAVDTIEVGSEAVEAEEGVQELVRTLHYRVHYRRRMGDPTLQS